MGPNCLKGLSADDNVMLRFNAKLNTSVQLQLVITSKVSIVWTWIRSGQNVGPDLGPNYLMSSADKGMKRFNAKIKYWFNSNLS